MDQQAYYGYSPAEKDYLPAAEEHQCEYRCQSESLSYWAAQARVVILNDQEHQLFSDAIDEVCASFEDLPDCCRQQYYVELEYLLGDVPYAPSDCNWQYAYGYEDPAAHAKQDPCEYPDTAYSYVATPLKTPKALVLQL